MTSRSDEQLADNFEKVKQLEKQLWELAESQRALAENHGAQLASLYNRIEVLEYKWGDGECEEKWTLLFENGNLDIDDDNQLHMYDSIEAAELAADDFDSNPTPVKLQIVIVEDE